MLFFLCRKDDEEKAITKAKAVARQQLTKYVANNPQYYQDLNSDFSNAEIVEILILESL